MGYNIFGGVAEQVAYITPVARTQFFRVYGDSDLVHRNPSEPRAHLSKLDPDELFYKVNMGEGNLVIPGQYTGMGKLMKHALGAVVDAGAGPSYTHTFTLTDGLPDYGLTAELHKGFSDVGFESKIGTGMKVRTMNVKAQVNEETQFNFGLLGRKVDLGAVSGAPSFTDLDLHAVNPDQIAVTIDAASANVFGVEFTLDNNLRDDRAFLGDAYLAEPKRAAGKRKITGTISKEWDDKTLYEKFISGATAALVITATGPTNYAMEITLNKIRFQDPTEETVEIDEIPQSLPFVAFLDATHTALKIVETNTTATT